MVPQAWARALCLLPFVLALVPAQTAFAAKPSATTAAALQSQIGVSKPSQGPHAIAGPNGLDKEVFGYATSGSLADPTVGYPSWNFDLLSTVAFFAIHVQYNGVLIADSNWSVWDSSTLTGLVTTAHAHGTKVVVTLVGPGGGAPIDQCDALYNDDTTILQIMNQVNLKGVDGVNIDYEGEFYQCTNNNPALNTSNQALMVKFAKDMRAALNAYKPGMYLSIATYSGSASANDGFFNIPQLNQYVDSFFVMAYDMDEANQGIAPIACSGFCMAPVSPLTNYYWNDTTSMNQYIAAVGAGKVILGQPYYGRVACVASPTAHAIATGGARFAATYLDAAAVISSPDVQPGTYGIHRDANDPTGQDRWDTWYDTRLGCWREMYWSDTTTLAVRYNFVNQNNLRGVGFWTLNYGGGAPELWTTLQTYFVACTGATVSASPVSPSLSGTAVQLTAGSSNCLNPLFQFWLLPPGGSWRIVQPYSSSAIYRWNTTGLIPGSYRFSVWVRDAISPGFNGWPPNTYDVFSAFDYQLTTSPCAAMTASAAPSSGPAGTAITITGAATGCPNPSYQFWILPPGGSWSIARAYSTSATFNWNTTGLAPGSYRFSVWARDASSLGTAGSAPYTYDAFSALPYTLGMPNCSAMTATATPASTANVGTPVSVAAAATGCPNPLFEFWLLPPGGIWTLVQSYSTAATFKWSTAGRPAGAYRFSVWARDAGSPNSYDSFSAFQYTLATAPCTAMTATPAPLTSATVGTTVTISGSATGCPAPLYEFWMLAPGGTWTLVQPYSGSATLTWKTTGKPTGAYRFSVWARDVSSSGTSGSAPYTYDSFMAFQYTLN